MNSAEDNRGFPVPAGILFGLGLGGFFDGIILHQVLQWHHMLTSAGYPPGSVHDLEINMRWDGLFHTNGIHLRAARPHFQLWRAAGS